ncbi:glycerophosphodiester phosphodiesterase [Thermococcus sp. EP1]|nr:glycerophosphodiester phosphodiesterase family protein [Thermococcus sp. EP1]KPU63558.1 glycerophosphodiester phosphodiesterase [Thermococcus sp. EP1]
MSRWDVKRVLVLGHRGSIGKYPENSLLAFVEAVKAGADGVELDVWLTKDRKVIVMHDETINRTSNMSGKQKEMTLEELQKADLGMKQRIPTLEDVLETLPKTALVNIEVKDIEAVSEVLRIINEFNAEERAMISSFNVNALKLTREMNERITLGLLVGDEKIMPLIPRLKEELNLYSVNVPIDGISVLGFERFKTALMWLRGLGVKIALWPVEEEIYYRKDNLKRLKGLFDIVITDDPERMLNYLKEIES